MPKAAAVKRVRGGLWVNRTFKKYKKWIAQGGYSKHSGDRHFILTDTLTGKTRVYESPEAAKHETKGGWIKAPASLAKRKKR